MNTSRYLPPILATWMLWGCATTAPSSPVAVTPPPNAGETTRLEMEPIKIVATKDGTGTHLEAFDASELFEQAGAALSDKRWEDAIRAYDRLLAEFSDSRYVRAALYNAGLAHQGKKDWAGAADKLKRLVDTFPDSPESKDGLFQLGATYAEMENWPASAETFARVLVRQDLSADDRIEAQARRGFAQFKLGDLETAERTFKSAMAFHHQVELQERLETDFYLGLCQYHLGQIPHERFRLAPLRLPDEQMSQDMEEKARLLLVAQRQYIETIKLGNPVWASASGYQIGALYEEFYDAFMHAPVPPELLTKGNEEKLEVYYEELRKKIRVLLEKSLRIHEKNLLMAERIGLQNEWRDKSRASYAKLQQLLDPSNKFEFAPPGSPTAVPEATPAPTPADAPVRPAISPQRKPPTDTGDEIKRQIL